MGGFSKPRPKDNFLTNTIKKATGNAAKSLVDCQKTCHGPLHYCDSRLMITTRCRYTSLTWFLIIGLPLIIILILVGVFVWRKKGKIWVEGGNHKVKKPPEDIH